MKRCRYCGNEYPDDATICFIDGESLPSNDPQPALSGEQTQGQIEAADKNVPDLTFPDYQWSARDAWKCIGMILVFEIVFFLYLRRCFCISPVFGEAVPDTSSSLFCILQSVCWLRLTLRGLNRWRRSGKDSG